MRFSPSKLFFFIINLTLNLHFGGLVFAQNFQNDRLRLVVPAGALSITNSAEFSKDGKFILTISEDNTIHVWDALSGKEVQVFKGHRSIVNTAKFSNDSKFVLSADDDGVAILSEIASGKIVLNKKFHEAKINSAIFSADDKQIITAGSDGQVVITNTKTLETTFQLNKFHSSFIAKAEISQNGMYLLAHTDDGRIYVWDVNNKRFIVDALEIVDLKIVQFSIDSKKLLIAGSGRKAIVWDIATDKLDFELKDQHSSDINNAIFSPSYKFMLTSGNDDYACLWDAKGKFIRNIANHKSGISSVAFSPDSKIILTAGEDHKISLWETQSGKKILSVDNRNASPRHSCFSPDSKYFMVSSYDKTRVWSVNTGNEMKYIISKRPKMEMNGISSNTQLGFVLCDGNIIVFDICNGKVIFSTENEDIVYAEFSTDSDKILSLSNADTVKVWDLYSSKLLTAFNGHKKMTNTVHFSPDSKLIITAGADNFVRIWNLKGEMVNEKVHNNSLNSAIYSPNQEFIITRVSSNSNAGIYDKTIRIWDVNLQQIDKNIGQHKFGSSIYSVTNDLLIVAFEDKKIKAYELKNSAEKYQIEKKHKQAINHIISSKCGRYFASASTDGKLCIFEAETGSELSQKFFEYEIDYLSFDSSSNYIVTVIKGNSTIWDFRSVKNGIQSDLVYVREHLGDTVKFLNSQNFYYSVDKDSRFTFWNFSEGKPIYKRIQLKDDNWLMTLPNSIFYSCSKDAVRMLHFVDDNLKIIGLEQLDPVYNRPDLVLEHNSKYFGLKDSTLIVLYRAAWNKRIDRLGLNINALLSGVIALPHAEITNKDYIYPETTDGALKIIVNASDSKYKLKRFNVWVNEVPCFGSNGLSLAHVNSNNWDTVMYINLGLGENKIQLAVMNELGLESYRSDVYTKYTNNKVVPKLYYVGIGVNNFMSTGRDLKFCEKDVDDLNNILEKFPNTSLILLKGKDVTIENVLAVKEILKKTTVHDKIVILCSTHGIIDSNDYYLAMYDTDFKNPKQRSLKYQDIENLLDGIPARKKVLLLDACNSGDYEIIPDKQFETSDHLLANSKALKRIIIESSFIGTFRLMNELFINTSNNTGAHVVSATGTFQDAFELDNLQNGVFSHAVIEFFKQNQHNPTVLSVKQLKKYVEKRVPFITKGMQTPTSRQETIEFDWYFNQDN